MCQLWTQNSSSNSSACRDEPLGPFSEEPGSGLSKGRKISEAHSEGLAWRAWGAGRGGTDGRCCGSPGSPPPGPELALRICAVVCRTQGDRPLLSKVSLAQIQVMVLLPHPSLFPLS